MKIRNKLTLIFTSIMALLLMILNISIYLVSGYHAREDYFDRLKARAMVAAAVYLERDEVSANETKENEKKFLNTMREEIVRIYNDQNKPVFIDSSDYVTYSNALINQVRAEKEFRGQNGDRQIVGISYDDNQGQFIIIVSAHDVVGTARLGYLRGVLLIGFISSLIILFFTGRFFTRLMLRPVAEITARTRTISETSLHQRLNIKKGKDELEQLALTINGMLERLENAFELQKSFVSNASHELRTPLTSIIGNIDVILSRERTQEEYQEILLSVQEEAEKMKSLANGLLNLAQSRVETLQIHRQEIRIDELMFEVKQEVESRQQGANMELHFPEMPADPVAWVIYGDINLMQMALLNLVENAAKFSGGKPVHIELLSRPDRITILIEDQGIGIPAADLSKIRETFYRAENARSFSGSGIGLALADKIISLHQGKMDIASTEGHGTTVTVNLYRSL